MWQAQMRFEHAVADSGAMLRQLAGHGPTDQALAQAQALSSVRAGTRHGESVAHQIHASTSERLAHLHALANDKMAQAAAAHSHAARTYPPPPPPGLVQVPPPLLRPLGPSPQLAPPPQLREYRSWLPKNPKPKTNPTTTTTAAATAAGEEGASGAGARTPLAPMVANSGKSPSVAPPSTGGETTPAQATPASASTHGAHSSNTFRGWAGLSDAAANPLIPHPQRRFATLAPEMTVESRLLFDDLSELQKDLRAMLD